MSEFDNRFKILLTGDRSVCRPGLHCHPPTRECRDATTTTTNQKSVRSGSFMHTRAA